MLSRYIKYVRGTHALWAPLFALGLISCATLVTDPVAELVIESVPTNVTVLYQGQALGVTPLKVYLPSKTKGDVRVRRFKLESIGYKNSTVTLRAARNPYVFGNAVFTSTTSGAPSIGSDYLSSYHYVFSDHSVVIEMRKKRTQVTLESDPAEREGARMRSDELEERRLKELEQLRQEKELAQKKLREERERIKALDRERLRGEQERLRREAERRDQAAKEAAEARELAELEARAEAKAREEAEAKARAEAEAKAREEAEAKARAEAEAKAREEAEARARAEAEAKAQREQGELKLGFDRLSTESSRLAAEREAFEKEKASLAAERARLAREREELEAAKARVRSQGRTGAQQPRGRQVNAPATKVPQRRSETIDEKERRLLKKIREHQRRSRERSRSKESRGLLKAPSPLPEFEVAPIESGALLSPSWGALALSVYAFPQLTRELASLVEVGGDASPALRSLFIRLSLSAGEAEELSWARYVMFKHLLMRKKGELLRQPHGLALFRQLKELALSAQICHSPSLIAGERAP